MESQRLNERWSLWAAVASLVAGTVVPFAGFADLLTWLLGERPNPYLYLFSWVFLGLAGVASTLVFAVRFSKRNPKNVRTALIAWPLFAFGMLPLNAALLGGLRAVNAMIRAAGVDAIHNTHPDDRRGLAARDPRPPGVVQVRVTPVGTGGVRPVRRHA